MAVVTDDDCDCVRPGELRRIVAGDLAARGFKVCEPENEESERLTITDLNDTHCEITVSDHGCVILYYWPLGERSADPAMITRLVLTALGRAGKRQEDRNAQRVSGLPLRGVVGRALKAAGLDVYLEVYDDQMFFEVSAEIVVTNPADRDRGEVRVDDHGGILWERWYPEAEEAFAGRVAEELAHVLTEPPSPEPQGRSPSSSGPVSHAPRCASSS